MLPLFLTVQRSVFDLVVKDPAGTFNNSNTNTSIHLNEKTFTDKFIMSGLFRMDVQPDILGCHHDEKEGDLFRNYVRSRYVG